tara:strand:+ start:426 stop:932 length:507 start_codon:yes stop_codon:yes gene_type:complete
MGAGSSASNNSGSSDAPMITRSTVKKKNPIVKFITGGGFTGAVIKSLGDSIKKANEQNRRNKLTSQFNSEEYPGGKKTIYTSPDNDKGSGGFNSNVTVPSITTAAKISPTKAEISQITETDVTTAVEEDPLYLRKKKTQAKGRSSTILTSSKGVDEGLTLGKKSLLGS